MSVADELANGIRYLIDDGHVDPATIRVNVDGAGYVIAGSRPDGLTAEYHVRRPVPPAPTPPASPSGDDGWTYGPSWRLPRWVQWWRR